MSVIVTERSIRPTPWGPAIHVQIGRSDNKRMSWRQVWETFAERHPGCWAIEVFPPAECLVDEVNAYHLFVLPPGVVPNDLRIDSR